MLLHRELKKTLETLWLKWQLVNEIIFLKIKISISYDIVAIKCFGAFQLL
jgi:hypothetical protein